MEHNNVRFHGRTWVLVGESAYHYLWESDLGDTLRARFEQAPTINGQELPGYGEDLEEILQHPKNQEMLSIWLEGFSL